MEDGWTVFCDFKGVLSVRSSAQPNTELTNSMSVCQCDSREDAESMCCILGTFMPIDHDWRFVAPNVFLLGGPNVPKDEVIRAIELVREKMTARYAELIAVRQKMQTFIDSKEFRR